MAALFSPFSRVLCFHERQLQRTQEQATKPLVCTKSETSLGRQPRRRPNLSCHACIPKQRRWMRSDRLARITNGKEKQISMQSVGREGVIASKEGYRGHFSCHQIRHQISHSNRARITKVSDNKLTKRAVFSIILRSFGRGKGLKAYKLAS